jgi:2-polyprenyl-3-methyl-5-hydroxy-6-metoxy-1,4-benzoquinol methylase
LNTRETPDIETSSADYARRFSGAAGRYLLDIQARAVERALRGIAPGTVLDVGGGHGQLVDVLRARGFTPTVHGSDAACEANLRELHGQRDCEFLQGDLLSLPAPAQSYDVVVAVRLVSHVERWRRLVAEMCRVARHAVLIDYPSTRALNALTPLLFGMKKQLEGNTRSYTSFAHDELEKAFARNGFVHAVNVKQLFLPMVVHRAARAAAPLRAAEAMARAVGLTAVAGSPVIARFDRAQVQTVGAALEGQS